MKIVSKIAILFYSLFFLSSCQLGYILNSAHQQFSMMQTRVPVDEALKSTDLTAEQKRKIQISQKARVFAFEKLKLKKTDNYSTFIDLKRPYVTWIVHAAEKWEMKTYEWKYPVVGKMPYKGFFTEAEARTESNMMTENGYDSYVRGVSAYSTLGWLTDSVLSSMLRYKDHDLVNTIIHEIVHTTIYIKNNADFNERLAVFIGNKGAEIFYRETEGPDSETLKLIRLENEDDQLFSKFISNEIAAMTEWYVQNQSAKNIAERDLRLQVIIQNFDKKLAPSLKTKSYEKFNKEPMNNARLGLYKTYMENLDDFELVYKKYNQDLLKFIEVVKTLESSDNPSEDFKNL